MLEGGGPPDVVEVTLALAEEMLMLAGIDADPAAALADGRAMDRWRRMIRAQGGDPEAPLPVAPIVEGVRAQAAGVVEHIDAMAVGLTAWRLGAGRAQRGHPVSPGAGVILRAAPGEAVAEGQVLAELHADDEDHLESGRAAFADAFRVGKSLQAAGTRVLERVEAR